jgi:RING finger protein 113A
MEERAFASSGTAASLLPEDMGATASNEIDTERERDRLAAIERSLQLNEELTGLADDKIYRGQGAYAQYLTNKDKETGATSTSKIKVGPMRASSNIRVTCRFDYQPDVCKDYKETGFCGYGDSCKFMHDRGDYKSGWQIDREWEKSQKQAQEARLYGDMSGDEEAQAGESESGDGLPFACLICRQEFKRPVVTKCKHYFCETCAIKNFTKSPKCFACGASTAGIFMPAKELIERLAIKHQTEAEENSDEQKT